MSFMDRINSIDDKIKDYINSKVDAVKDANSSFDESVKNFPSNVDTAIEAKIQETMGGLLESIIEIAVVVFGIFFALLLELLKIIILVYVIWSCFSLIMGREETTFPLFGTAKALDSVFYSTIFYTIFAIVQAYFLQIGKVGW